MKAGKPPTQRPQQFMTSKLPAKRSYQQFNKREVRINGGEVEDGEQAQCHQFGFTNVSESQVGANGVKSVN